MSAPLFYLLRSYDYYSHVAGLLPAKFCLVMLLIAEKVRNLKDYAIDSSFYPVLGASP